MIATIVLKKFGDCCDHIETMLQWLLRLTNTLILSRRPQTDRKDQMETVGLAAIIWIPALKEVATSFQDNEKLAGKAFLFPFDLCFLNISCLKTRKDQMGTVGRSDHMNYQPWRSYLVSG